MNEKIRECVDNIEQLAADSRYLEDVDRLLIKFESIENWTKLAKRRLEGIQKNQNNLYSDIKDNIEESFTKDFRR